MPKQLQPIDRLLLSVGAMKAGTTWLYAVLKSHPDIFFTQEKEIHFFGRMHNDIDHMTRAYRFERMMTFLSRANPESMPMVVLQEKLRWYADFLMNIDQKKWYTRLFKGRKEEKYCADFSNLNAYLDDSGWSHVRQIAKEVRVVYTLRDPLKRLWSHLKFELSRNGLENELRNAGKRKMRQLVCDRNLWEHSCYSKHIASMQSNLDDHELCIAIFDEIHEDPRSWLHSFEDFLDIQHIKYPAELLKSSVNTTKSDRAPQPLCDAFGKDVEEEIFKLKDLGVTIPSGWSI